MGKAASSSNKSTAKNNSSKAGKAKSAQQKAQEAKLKAYNANQETLKSKSASGEAYNSHYKAVAAYDTARTDAYKAMDSARKEQWGEICAGQKKWRDDNKADYEKTKQLTLESMARGVTQSTVRNKKDDISVENLVYETEGIKSINEFTDEELAMINAAADRITREPTAADRWANLMKLPGHVMRNVLWLLFGDATVRSTNNYWFNKDYERGDTVLVAFHGYWQTGAASCGYMQNVAKKFNKPVFVGQYNYAKSVEECVEDTAAFLRYVRDKVGKDARIVVFGHSTGAQTVSRLAQKHPELADEFMPVAGLYNPITKGAFAHYPMKLLLPDKDKGWSETTRKLTAVGANSIYGTPKMSSAWYGKFEQMAVDCSKHPKEGIKNMGLNTGHFGEIMSKDAVSAYMRHVWREPEVKSRLNVFGVKSMNHEYDGFFERASKKDISTMIDYSSRSLEARHR